MAKRKNVTVLKGSDRAAPLHGAEAVGKVPESERFEVTIREIGRAHV